MSFRAPVPVISAIFALGFLISCTSATMIGMELPRNGRAVISSDGSVSDFYLVDENSYGQKFAPIIDDASAVNKYLAMLKQFSVTNGEMSHAVGDFRAAYRCQARGVKWQKVRFEPKDEEGEPPKYVFACSP